MQVPRMQGDTFNRAVALPVVAHATGKRRRRLRVAELHLLLCAAMTGLVLFVAAVGPLGLAGCLYAVAMVLWAVRV